MPEYIFYTSEGYTISPNNNELDSLQILGFEKGNNFEEAKQNLINNNPWIIDSGFNLDEIKSKIIIDEKSNKLISEIIDYLYKDEEKHFEESDKPEDHIFLKIKDLKNFIENN